MAPEQPTAPETLILNHFVRIRWTAPYQNSAPINIYKVYIEKATASDFILDTVYCDGTREAIIANLYCEIPMSALRLDPYHLIFN